MSKKINYSSVITADLHLSLINSWGVMKGGINTRLLDEIRILDGIVDYAITNKVNSFFNLGDIFDRINPPEKLRKIFVEHVIVPLLSHGIDFYNLMGNHDTNNDIVSIESEELLLKSLSFKNKIININQPQLISLGDYSAYCVPYGFNIDLEEAMQSQICFAHHGLKGAITGVGVTQRDTDELNLDDYNNLNWIISGHYHKPQLITNKYTQWYYVGSPIKWDMAEREDEKRFLDFKIDNGVVSIDSILIKDRVFIQREINEGESWENIGNIKDCVVKLIFKGTKEWIKTLNIRNIKKLYEEQEAHKVGISIEIKDNIRKVALRVSEEQTEEQIIRDYCKENRIDEELIDFGLEIFENIKKGN